MHSSARSLKLQRDFSRLAAVTPTLVYIQTTIARTLLLTCGLLSLSLGSAAIARAGTIALDFNPAVTAPAAPDRASESQAAESAKPTASNESVESAEPSRSDQVRESVDSAPIANPDSNEDAIVSIPGSTPSSTPSTVPIAAAPPTPSPKPKPTAPATSANSPGAVPTADLFAGDSSSLVARTVGYAEGTRTAEGGKTQAYYGHVDPGNGVWNRGSFSYQFGNAEDLSPEESDQRQLSRLKVHHQNLLARAQTYGVNFTLEEELNGIDLANQAPLAAVGTPGYVEALRQAHDRGLTGSDAVLWARVQSYWSPEKGGWDAPGLGNTEDRITHDQARRQDAIARALQIYQQEKNAPKANN